MKYNKLTDIFKAIIIVLVIGVIVFGLVYFDYYWTKSSLEDLSGKEVSPSTVIWTMMKTGNKK